MCSDGIFGEDDKVVIVIWGHEGCFFLMKYWKIC